LTTLRNRHVDVTGTVLAIDALCECKPFSTQKQAKRNVVEAVKRVAETLGNTVTVSRNCYIHPGVFEKYMRGALCRPSKERDVARMLVK
jgi:DNA topoisomerase I